MTTALKTCFKCGIEKSRIEFYKHPRMEDGLLGKCKECTKKDVSEHRNANIEELRRYDKERSTEPHRRELAKRVSAQWRKRHPLRKKAQTALRGAVLAGKVTPLPCFVCGEKAEAHHPDYSAPLDVVWLCSPHHKQAHVLTRK